MPVFRNVHPKRHSGRLEIQTPFTYGDGWPAPESINYLSNGETVDGSVSLCTTSSPSSLSPTVPQFDRSYSHSRQQERTPCIPSDEQYQSLTITTARHPSRRESHGRRREPGHIPRPRNAFIIFRSYYINDTSSGEDQQNELSKQAGKVWNTMTKKEKEPFVTLAINEKEQHQAMYPNYTYCPGRGAARRKSRTKNTSGPKRKTSAASSSASFASSESTFLEAPFVTPAQQSTHAAAPRAIESFFQPHFIFSSPSISPKLEESPILDSLELAYPGLDSLAEEDACTPINYMGAFTTHTPAEETASAPIVLEPKKEKIEPQFDLTMRPLHLDSIPEQFGFKYHSDSTAMLAYLPPMPNSDTGDVPSLYTRCLPGNPPSVCMTEDDPFVFSPDGNITEVWPQPTTHHSEIAPMHVPGFAWSSYHENFHYTSMHPENTWPENDMAVMGSYFKFEEL